MIYCVEGVLLDLKKLDGFYLAAVKCKSGLGFELKVSSKTAAEIENEKDVSLFCSFILRENVAELFGFSNLEERESFKLLISVSGVGPSFALSILSFLTPFELFSAINLKDCNKLCECKGIGLKTANRIVLELKDKIKNFEIGFLKRDEKNIVEKDDVVKQAIEALIVLGYGKSQATDVVLSQKGGGTVESLVKDALLILNGK